MESNIVGDVFACQEIFLLGNFQGEDRFLHIERLILEGNIILLGTGRLYVDRYDFS